MENPREINFLDYIVLLVKWKKFILFTVLITMIVSYVGIYFLIEEEFESTTLIIPSEDNMLSGVSSLMKGLKSLPVGIPGTSMNTETDNYNTILDSRTTLDEIIKKYNLYKVFNLDTTDIEHHEKALKRLKSSIFFGETKSFAYKITVTPPDRVLSARIANSLVEILNRRLVELKVKKSKENRQFLELRLLEIKSNLRNSEDSLRLFQEATGILDAKEQVKGLLSAYSLMETNLIAKQIEESILSRVVEAETPQLKNIKIQIQEYKEKLDEIKRNGQPDGLMLSIDKLPMNAVNYFRLYRDIEINNLLLEFIIPLYEQAKFEEQKEIPVLQIVDNAVPAVKKSYPPRTVLVLIIGFAIFLITYFYILIKENKNIQDSEKYKFIKKNLFKWKVV